ncbi:MAG TPA: peptidoglycan DD-metalloendopeptidase family protein [Rugosimonospora sp.]|nr:peptidoglycan DD-metalloendopeptidase family protein [Rugosimonospora sp.]
MRLLGIGLGVLAGATVLSGTLGGVLPAHAANAPTTGVIATGHGPVNLRATPSSAAAKRGTLPNGRSVSLVCRVTGQQVRGYVRSSNQWDLLSTGAYVSDGYVRRAVAPQVCPSPTSPGASTSPGTTDQTTGWMAPVVAPLGDGFRPPSRPTHQGVDLLAARNTPIRSAAAGTVITVTCNTAGGNCDVDGSMTSTGCGWYVEVLHQPDVITRYCHLGHRPLVQVGQEVTEGQVLGYVGSSGHSSGPHLHFEVHVGTRPATNANAIDPVAFMRTHGAPLGLTAGSQ